jgi:hypothetical protein
MAQFSAAKRRAALPRKSDPDGAASGQTIALSRASKYNGRARQPLASQASAAKRRLKIGKIMDSKIIVKFRYPGRVARSRNALWQLEIKP